MINIGRYLIKAGPSLVKNINTNQIRTAFVVKRKYPMPMTKKGHKPRALKPKNYVYELVEDTDMRVQEDLHLILNTYVEGVGKRGDEVRVRPQKGYETLLLPGLAEYYTEEAKERLSADSSDEPGYSSPYVERMSNVLSRMVISITMNKDEAWTLQPWHVRASMRKCGLYVQHDSQITLPADNISGPDLSLQNKEFLAYVTINNKEQPLIPEQEEELSKIPLPKIKEEEPVLLGRKR
ncbi:hypothetical protein B566_EDAN008544 [Ephemera danica]|nr:hypothetical protein B566_EDAN008544 [Ephemera danica]